MIIGILSDTHNNTDKIIRAVDFFNLRQAEIVLHAGDFSMPSSAKYFSKLKGSFISVFGNNDFQEHDLSRIINNFGIISHAPYNFVIDNKIFTLTHYLYGNYNNTDYVIYGHTHKPRIQKINNCTYINPGECCARRYGRSTVALLDTNTENAQIFDITDL